MDILERINIQIRNLRQTLNNICIEHETRNKCLHEQINTLEKLYYEIEKSRENDDEERGIWE